MNSRRRSLAYLSHVFFNGWKHSSHRRTKVTKQRLNSNTPHLLPLDIIMSNSLRQNRAPRAGKRPYHITRGYKSPDDPDIVPETPPGTPEKENEVPPNQNILVANERHETTRSENSGHSIAVIDALLKKYVLHLDKKLDQQFSEMRKQEDRRDEKMDTFQEDLNKARSVLSAMALYLGSQNVAFKNLNVRPQTAAHTATLNAYLLPLIMIKSGCYIITTYAIEFVKGREHSFELGQEVLELLLFSPRASQRTEQRRSFYGKAFLDMRYALTHSYVSNCCYRAQRMVSSRLQDTETRKISAADLDEVAGNSIQEQLSIHEAQIQNSIWTEKDYITDQDIHMACDSMTRLNSHSCADAAASESLPADESAPMNKRRKMNDKSRTLDEEVKQEVLKEMWRKQTKFFSNARLGVRRVLTQILGVLFEPTAKATWEFKLPREYLGKLDSIVLTTQYKGENMIEIAARKPR